jgi:hypothetical protein
MNSLFPRLILSQLWTPRKLFERFSGGPKLALDLHGLKLRPKESSPFNSRTNPFWIPFADFTAASFLSTGCTFLQIICCTSLSLAPGQNCVLITHPKTYLYRFSNSQRASLRTKWLHGVLLGWHEVQSRLLHEPYNDADLLALICLLQVVTNQ